MAETKKFLDQSGVSILWSRINEELEKKQTTLDTHTQQITTMSGKIEALEQGTYDDTEIRGLISNNTQAIETLNGTGEGSVDKKVANEIAKIVNDNANGSIDTLNEIAAWIVNDTTGAAKMANDITALKAQLVGVDSTVVDKITAMIDSALKNDGVDKYALAADLTALAGRVDTLENAGYQTAAQVGTAIDNKIATLDIPSVAGLSEAEIDAAIASASTTA